MEREGRLYANKMKHAGFYVRHYWDPGSSQTEPYTIHIITIVYVLGCPQTKRREIIMT